MMRSAGVGGLWIAGTAVGLLAAGAAVAQLRVVNYNVAQLQGDPTELQKVFLALTEDPAPGSGLIRVPDVYVLQEVQPHQTTTILDYLNAAAPDGVVYVLATFTVNGGGGENALYYRVGSVFEDSAEHRDLTNHDGPRATDRWKLRLSGQLDRVIYVYGSHFKADTGFDNENARASEADAIRGDADALGDGAHVIYAGDWNLYSAAEPAFQRFLDEGPGHAVDPGFGGLFPPRSHTQSPSDGTMPELTTGGMDDRFDFQLSTDEFSDGLGLTVEPGSYRAFGNDGAHFNRPINDGFNGYFLEDEQWKADALARASDHLPVVVDYRIPGDPFVLRIDPLTAGEPGHFEVRGGGANRPVYVAYSTAGLGSTDVASLGVTLRLDRPILAAKRRTDGTGTAIFTLPIPGGASGWDVWFQAAKPGATTDPVYRRID